MNKKISLSVVMVLLAVILSSCSIFKGKTCTREYAGKKGMEDAQAGRTSQPGKLEGSSCEGEYPANVYYNDYQLAYNRKKEEICNKTNATNLGRTDGEQGLANKPQRMSFGACDANAAKFEREYDSAFSKAFCSADRATKAGAAKGSALQPNTFDSSLEGCPGVAGLKSTFNKSYKTALTAACTEGAAEGWASADAAAGKRDDSAGKITLCGQVTKANLKARYDAAYGSAQARLEQERAARAAAEQARIAAEQQRQADEAARIRHARQDEFMRNTATSYFPYGSRSYVARCTRSPDHNSISVEVENPHPEQVTIQGTFRVQYYNADFNKITEDRTQEALLLPPGSRKAFLKYTLPRDMVYCRAEYVVPSSGSF